MTNTNTRIPIACVGSGWVTEHRHIPAVLRSRYFRLQRIIGIDAKRVNTLAKKFSIPAAIVLPSTDPKEIHPSILSDCAAVLIGTDPMSHAKIANACARLKKHILCEKPLTLSPEESDHLLHTVHEHAVSLAVMHNFLFARSLCALEHDLNIGCLGIPRGLLALQFSNPRRRLPQWYENLPGGLFYDEGPHLLYLLSQYGNACTLDSSFITNSSSERKTPITVSAHFTCGSGIPADLYMNFAAPVSEWFFVVLGEKKLGVCDLFRDMYISVPNDGRHNPAAILRTVAVCGAKGIREIVRSGIEVIRGRHDVGADRVVERFGEHIRSGASLGMIDGKHGARIVRLLHEIMNGSQTK